MLMILKEIYSVMGVTPLKPGTDAVSAQQFNQAPYLPTQQFHPPGPHPLPMRPQFTNGSSSDVGGMPMFTAPHHMSTGAIGGPPLPTAPGTTYLEPSPHPVAMAPGQPSAVGPPPKTGFVRK